MIWMFSGSTITKLASLSLGAVLLRGPLNTPDTWIMGQSQFQPPAATIWSGAASLQKLPAALHDDARGVVLDLEHWRFTPVAEQSHPVQTYEQAATEAKRYGKWLMATPSLNLFHKRPLADAYLRSRIAYRIAPYVRAYDIQAQGLERNPARYAHFVSQVAQQLRAANPRIVMVAGISVNPGGAPVTLPELQRDIVLTRGMVQGYWLAIPSRARGAPPRVALAARLLQTALAKD
ncbi:hypothetical protein AB4090_13905 [Acidithiobacillus sp. IBUN Pt1247-S3]|uniref:hypothetical protein n=1 Tax=Acidithiobacillus sp. IBUN Pt1247-S3 TaxID=3166642 RepID=UPI0034E3CB53